MIQVENKIKNLPKKKKISLFVFVTFCFLFIVFLCFLAETVEDLSKRRLIILISCVPFIVFFIVDFILMILPDKELIVSKIKPLYFYLEDYGYSYSEFYNNKKSKTLEIYYTNPTLLDICFVASLKDKCHWSYILSSDKKSYIGIDAIYKALKNQNKIEDEITVREILEFIISAMQEDKIHVEQIISLIHQYNIMGINPFGENETSYF